MVGSDGRRRRGRDPGGPLALATALLAGSDPPDLAAWEALLAPEAHLRLGNRSVVVGRPACLNELKVLFARTAALGRGFRELWPSADRSTVLIEVDLTPMVEGPTVPVAIIARTISPEFQALEVRFYLDPAPLGLDDASEVVN